MLAIKLAIIPTSVFSTTPIPVLGAWILVFWGVVILLATTFSVFLWFSGAITTGFEFTPSSFFGGLLLVLVLLTVVLSTLELLFILVWFSSSLILASTIASNLS